MDIAKRLNMYCNHFKLSQPELSRLSGVGQSTISKIRSGKNPYPRIDILERLCAGMGITLSEFFAEPKEDALPPEARKMVHDLELLLKSLYTTKHPSK